MHNTIVTVETVAARVDDPDWVLVDCRHALGDPEYGRRAYAKDHVPGAVYAHLDDDLASAVTPESGRHPLPDVATISRRLGQWGIGPATQVVAYDDGGGAIASRLWWLLRWLGHDAVAVLDGGFNAWLAAGLPVDDTAPPPRSAEFVAQPRDSMMITLGELAAALGRGMKLVDVRDAERFRGSVEPIDTVPGHVPGARNDPFSNNLDDDGRFRPADELRARLVAVLDGTTPEQTACMCGSGVTACHTLLAMEMAGLPGARLYVGSWSEWIRDPDRPVATGAD